MPATQKKPASKASAKKSPKVAAKVVKKPEVKAAAKKPVAPVKAAAVKAAAPVAAKPAAKPQAAAARPAAPVAVTQPRPAAVALATGPRKLFFKINELIVYPAHGVGKVVQIEEQEIAGAKLELYIIDFEKEKLRLKVPTNTAAQKGMRRLADKGLIEQAMRVLKGRARIKRTMWSRRAQEYEAKINSGDLFAVAEVVRDLYRSERQPEQSYSERQLFEQALERMSREIAAVRKMDDDQGLKELSDYLVKNARRVPAPGEKTEEELPAEQAA